MEMRIDGDDGDLLAACKKSNQKAYTHSCNTPLMQCENIVHYLEDAQILPVAPIIIFVIIKIFRLWTRRQT